MKARPPWQRSAMGKVFDSIDDKLRRFIESQKMFFVATAPSNGGFSSTPYCPQTKRPRRVFFDLAERVGFEPTKGY